MFDGPLILEHGDFSFHGNEEEYLMRIAAFQALDLKMRVWPAAIVLRAPAGHYTWPISSMKPPPSITARARTRRLANLVAMSS